jgi:hypothetical protein
MNLEQLEAAKQNFFGKLEQSQMGGGGRVNLLRDVLNLVEANGVEGITLNQITVRFFPSHTNKSFQLFQEEKKS